jgi:hypothetical protein
MTGRVEMQYSELGLGARGASVASGMWSTPKVMAINCLRRFCKLGLVEGIVSKKLNAPYRSGPSKTWIKVKKSEGVS